MTSTTPINLSATKRPDIPTARHFIVLWLVVAALEGVLLLNHATLDSLLWNTTRWVMGDQDYYKWDAVRQPPGPGVPYYLSADPPMQGRIYKRTENIWRLFRDMGEPDWTVIVLILVGIYDRRRWLASGILLCAAAVPSLVSELIRCITGRLRPDGTLPDGTRNAGESIFHFLGGFSNHHDLSFPSGHATLAFAIAAALTYFSPRGRILFIVLAVGCELARVVMQAHFFSDAILGAAIGWTFGWLITVQLDRLLQPVMQKMAPQVV